jgi:hypothetical protein
MNGPLFDDIDALLADRRGVLEGRRKFATAMTEAEYQAELWEAIRPFVRGPNDYRAAYTFMAAMLRERSRDLIRPRPATAGISPRASSG